MRNALILLFLTAFQVFAEDSYSQKTRLSLKLNDVTVEQILEEIEKQSEFYFLCNKKLVDVSRKVNIQSEDKTINDVLAQLFHGTDVDYVVLDRQIVLTPGEYLANVKMQMQPVMVTGTVTDENGEPLPGVSVYLQGTTKGTITDLDGRYTMEIDYPPTAVLVFSYMGFLTREIAVGDQVKLDVIMSTDVIGLEEIVVVGYGSMKKIDLTGSVIQADLEAFEESPNTSIIQSLQGSIPGVQIGQVKQAGANPSISIRGETTLSGNTDVLIVLDGIIYRGNILDIHPDDVQSIEILKDASSKAIYGAQSANGVILITTKNGITEKPTIKYSVSGSFYTPTSKTRLLNRGEFLQKVKDVNYTDAYLAPDYIEENPDWDYAFSELGALQLEGLENGTNHDWWDEATRLGHQLDQTLSINNKTKNTSYYISVGYTDQKGILMNDDYKRTSVRINFETEIMPWLTFGANSFGSFSDYSGIGPSLKKLYYTSPLVNSKDENGEYIIYPLDNTSLASPFLPTLSDDQSLLNNFSGNFFALLKIPWIEGLSYRINYSRFYQVNSHYYSNEYDLGLAGYAYKYYHSQNDETLDNIITYERTINDDHKVHFTLLAGYNKVRFESGRADGEGYTDLTLSYNSLQLADIQEISSSAWKESSMYQMGRINYNYKNKYLLTATLRRDGYSGFSKNNKVALFPSAGIGWVLSEESFFKSSIVDYVKLRASYGYNGNLTSRYSSLSKISIDETSLTEDQKRYYVFGDGASTSLGQEPITLANNDLTWELTKEFNFGLDFNILRSRIRGNIDIYKEITTDLLWNVSLPDMTGFSSVISNIGKIDNTGIEIKLDTRPIVSNDFSWESSISFSSNQNKVVELLGIDEDGDGKEDDLVASGLFIGHPIGTIYDYETDGIWQLDDEMPTGFMAGTYRIVDQNGDGDISADEDRIILGHTEPAFRFGFQNTFKYKGFSLRFFIHGIQGGKDGYLKANNPDSWSYGTSINYNWFNNYDYWSPSNPDAEYPQRWLYPVIEPNNYQSRSFIRLQDVSLAYDLKSSLLKKWKVSQAKIYISGKNLITWTRWDGWDPETGQTFFGSDHFPVMRTYAIGLDFSF